MCRTWHKNVNGIGFTWLIFLVLLCIQNESFCLLSTKANLIVHIELKIQQSTFRYHLLTKIRCVTISNSVIKCHLNGQNPYWRTVHVHVCQIWVKFRIPKYIYSIIIWFILCIICKLLFYMYILDVTVNVNETILYYTIIYFGKPISPFMMKLIFSIIFTFLIIKH